MKSSTHKSQSGFVAIFAVLLAMIVLAISIGIANVSYKEVVLSSSAREANSAFFAADSGAECLLLWDIKKQVFPRTAGGAQIDCFGMTQNNSFSPIPYDNEGSTPSYAFGYEFDLGDSCARIEVHKYVEDSGVYYTKIESKGYNMSCSARDAITPGTTAASRLVERAVRASYVEAVATAPSTP